MGYVLYCSIMLAALVAGWMGDNATLSIVGAALMANGALTLVWRDMKEQGDVHHQ